MAETILNDVKITRVSNAVAAGVTTVNSNSIDMQGYEGAVFTVHFGTITAGAVTSIKLQQSSDNTNFFDLAGTAISIPDTSSNKMVAIEVYKPEKRYVKLVVNRATQNAVIDSIAVEQFESRVEPPTHDASVQATKYVVSPIEGTP